MLVKYLDFVDVVVGGCFSSTHTHRERTQITQSSRAVAVGDGVQHGLEHDVVAVLVANLR